jgi:hypothetical protein
MYATERRALYEKLGDLCEELLEDKSNESTVILQNLMKGLVIRPYAVLTFLNLFKYIHLSGTKIHSKDVEPHTFNDDLFIMIFKQNVTYDLAEEFDQA